MDGYRPYSNTVGPKRRWGPDHGRLSTIFQGHRPRTTLRSRQWTVIDHIPRPPTLNNAGASTMDGYRPYSNTASPEQRWDLDNGRLPTISKAARGPEQRWGLDNGRLSTIHSLRRRRLTAPSRYARQFSVQIRIISWDETRFGYGRLSTIFQSHRAHRLTALGPGRGWDGQFEAAKAHY